MKNVILEFTVDIIIWLTVTEYLSEITLNIFCLLLSQFRSSFLFHEFSLDC